MSQAEATEDWRTLTAEMDAVEPQPTRTVMRREYDKRLMLVTGRANPDLAAKIADKLGVELSEVNTKTFDNGEVYCRYGESVRGADVFIVQPTCANASEGIKRAAAAPLPETSAMTTSTTSSDIWKKS